MPSRRNTHEKPTAIPRFARLLSLLLIGAGLSAGCVSGAGPGELEGEAKPGQAAEPLVTSGPVLELQPGAEGIDARVFSLPAGADTNYGNLSRIEAMAWTWSGVPATVRSFIDFDLSSLPAGSFVRRATLVLQAEVIPGGQPSGHSTLSGPNDFMIEPVIAPWQEGTLTWNNQPATDPSRAVHLPASSSIDQAYEADVTALVRAQLQAPNDNHGFMLHLQNEQYYRAVQFASSDHADPSKRPKLVLELASAARVAANDCSVDFTTSHQGLDANFNAFLMTGTNPTDYSWDFGDGDTDVGIMAHHSYAQAGTYLVCVTMQATDPTSGDPCEAKICKPVPVMSITGSCCDRNDKDVDKEVEYAPGHFAKFEFRLRNVGIVDAHSLVAEVTTYSGTSSNKKREKVDHLYADIIGVVHAVDKGVTCSTATSPVDGYDNNQGESHLKVKIPFGQTAGLGAGDAKAYFSVRVGSVYYSHELSLAECKADGQSCSRDSACGSGSCGGCLSAELGWCFTPYSAAYGAECKADKQCQSTRCSADCYLNPTGKCLCKDNSDCQSGEYCGWGFNSGKCQNKKGNGSACAGNAECQSGACGGIFKGLGACYEPKSKNIGQGCRADGECTTNRCVDTRLVCGCTNDDQCGGDFCNKVTGECRPKRGKNALCSRDAQCASGKCRTIGLCKG